MIKEVFERGYKRTNAEPWRSEKRLERILWGDVPSFLEVPIAKKTEELQGADAVVLGIPFEGIKCKSPSLLTPALATPAGPDSVYYRTGADKAPDAVRKYSIHYSIEHSGLYFPDLVEGIVVLNHLQIVDYGNVSVLPDDPEESWQRAIAKVSDIVRSGAVPFVLGGDHSVPYPTVRGILNETKKKIGIIGFDSHFDLSFDPKFWAGSQWARILETEEIKVSNFVQVGIRGVHNTLTWKNIASELGYKWFSMTEIKETGIVPVMEKAIDIASTGTDAIYVSLDIDVMDPAFVPAQKYPDVCGLTSWEMIKALRMIATKEIAGFDVACLGPQYDLNGISSLFVSRCILELLAGMALRKR
jgi:agmatinase